MQARSELIGEFDRIIAETDPRKPLIAGKESLSYGTLVERVRRLTSWFRSLGLRPGDRLVIATQDDNATIIFFMAALRNGVAAAVIDPAAPAEEAKILIAAADPVLLCIDRSSYEAAGLRAALPATIKIIQIEPDQPGTGGITRRLAGLFGGGKAAAPKETYPAALARWDVAPEYLGDVGEEASTHILFTSGTTSRPKGVELSHRNLQAQMRAFASQYGFTPESRILNSLPMHHADGLTQGAALAFFMGCTVYRHQRFSLQDLPELLISIYKDRITHLVTVPTILALMLRLATEVNDAFTTPDFKFIVSTAAHLDEKLWRDFEERFKVIVVNSYGLTETVNEAIYCGPDAASRRVGTIGKPNGAEARIVGPGGEVVGAGEIGELTLRGSLIMKGYFRNPEATAEVIKDGWFHTGDLATIDADGFYRIVGRKKSVIIRGGLNVYPEDVTRVLRAVPGVLDAVTFGMPDAVWGETVLSCVVPAAGRQLAETDLIAACRAGLAPEKVPSGVHIFDDFPRGPSGKIVLNEIKALVEARRAQGGGAVATGDVEARLIALAATCFQVEPQALSLASTSDGTTGWDSLTHVNLVDAIEESFAIKLSPRDIMRLGSLRDAHAMILAAQAKSAV
jgi:acyl-CoA synthetase (AMP-forming)/AMP-acid ligase II/acyl carrier protein